MRFQITECCLDKNGEAAWVGKGKMVLGGD